jgi:hypothetical protein
VIQKLKTGRMDETDLGGFFDGFFKPMNGWIKEQGF